jgi:hypothetical protein
LDELVLLTKRKNDQSRLLSIVKRRRNPEPAASAALAHEKQLAVVDAVEWAAERWAARDLIEHGAGDPRAAHAARLIAALVYLDERFGRLKDAFVTEIIDRVASAGPNADSGPRLDAKAAATLLAVEVRAFGR